MKKNRWGLMTGIAMVSLLLVGCATPMHELTAEEEELIIHYAANVVAKHNVYQKDGMNSLLPEETEETESSENTQNTEESTDTDTEGGNAGENNQTTKPEVSIAEKLGYKDLEITYSEGEFLSVYEESIGMSVVAPEGTTLYVMPFTVSNPTKEPVLVDNITLNPVFKLVKADYSLKAEITLLSTDLSTYVGEIQPDETIELVLLFEVPEEKTSDILGASLKVITD